MARSKSSSRKAAAAAPAGGFDFKSAEVQLAVAVAAVAGMVYATQGEVHTKDAWFNFFGDQNGAIPMFGFGSLLTTLHVLNSSQNSGGGHWAQSFFNAYLAAFGGKVLTSLLNGASFASIVADETDMTLSFICWYLTNHDIPLVKFDLWGMVSEAGGAALGHVLDLASLIWTTNLITGAVGASGSNALFGFGVFGAVVAAHAAGCASSYFPLNRGIDIDTSSVEAERATWTALFISSNAFASLPLIGKFVAQAVGALNFAGLTNAELVMVMTLLQWLENNQNYTNFHPLTPVYETFYKVTGL